jgi:hypothetical protein
LHHNSHRKSRWPGLRRRRCIGKGL